MGIPLQAYNEAGVARTLTDWVTERDVERLMGVAYEARSVAHDINTHWGSMPGGGALKYSNHFFGCSHTCLSATINLIEAEWRDAFHLPWRTFAGSTGGAVWGPRKMLPA